MVVSAWFHKCGIIGGGHHWNTMVVPVGALQRVGGINTPSGGTSRYSSVVPAGPAACWGHQYSIGRDQQVQQCSTSGASSVVVALVLHQEGAAGSPVVAPAGPSVCCGISAPSGGSSGLISVVPAGPSVCWGIRAPSGGSSVGISGVPAGPSACWGISTPSGESSVFHHRGTTVPVSGGTVPA